MAIRIENRAFKIVVLNVIDALGNGLCYQLAGYGSPEKVIRMGRVFSNSGMSLNEVRNGQKGA